MQNFTNLKFFEIAKLENFQSQYQFQINEILFNNNISIIRLLT